MNGFSPLRTSLIFLSVCGNFLLNGCSDSAPEQDMTGSTQQIEQPVAKATAAPARTVRAGDQRIPVYENFDGLAPLFEQQNDTTYVINFWATWCKPCVEELPYFERLHEAFDGEKLRVVLVSLDFERDLETKLKTFVEERGLQSDVLVLLDGNYNNWIDRVDTEWGGAIPVTVVYNAQRREFVGQQLPGYEELRHLVEGFL